MRLMFNNARTYNQEGSWVYVDAEEMEKAFNAAFAKHIVGSDLPGAPSSTGGAGGSSSQQRLVAQPAGRFCVGSKDVASQWSRR